MSILLSSVAADEEEPEGFTPAGTSESPADFERFAEGASPAEEDSLPPLRRGAAAPSEGAARLLEASP